MNKPWRVSEKRGDLMGEFQDGHGAHDYAERKSKADSQELLVEGPRGVRDRALYRNGKVFYFSTYCGAFVNADDGEHYGMTRCYCGWSESGGDGYSELVAMGETIEPEDY